MTKDDDVDDGPSDGGVNDDEDDEWDDDRREDGMKDLILIWRQQLDRHTFRSEPD